jgi:hypothetical protein
MQIRKNRLTQVIILLTTHNNPYVLFFSINHIESKLIVNFSLDLKLISNKLVLQSTQKLFFFSKTRVFNNGLKLFFSLIFVIHDHLLYSSFDFNIKSLNSNSNCFKIFNDSSSISQFI